MRSALASLTLLVALPLSWSCASSTSAFPRLEPEKPAREPARTEAIDGTWVDVTPAARPASAPAPRNPLELRLGEAISRALEENPDLHIIGTRIAAAEASLAEVRSAFRPTFGVGLDFLRADAPSMYLFKTIDAGRYRQNTDFNDPGAFSNWEAGLDVRYNLYNGGRDALQKQIAEEGVELARLQQAVARNALVAGVIDAWYTVLAVEEQILTARASVATTHSQVEEARVRFEEGSRLRSDLLSLEVREAEAEERVIRAENGRELALTALAQLLGMDASEVLTLDESAPLRLDELPPTFEAALDLAVDARPELESARRSVEVAERQLRQARSAYLPRADLFARGWYDSPAADFHDARENWALGVSLAWSLCEGGRRNAGIDGSRARLDEVKRADRKAMLAVQMDVKSAWVRLEDARQRLEVATSAVANAEETLQLVQARYESGAANVTRYLEAELMNTEAKMRRTNAAFDLERARADLMRATGGFAGAHAEAGR